MRSANLSRGALVTLGSALFCALACTPDPRGRERLDLDDDDDSAALDDDDETGGGDDETGAPPEPPDTGAGDDGVADAPPPGDGLPCDVEALLADDCRACHGTVPAGGAPNPMLSYDDLMAPSLTQPGRTVAEVSLERMRDAARPMPPAPLPTPDDTLLTAWDVWLADGAPQTDCDGDVPPGPGPDEPDPFAVDAVCTSDRLWPGGLFLPNPQMNPGRTCIACHTDPAAFGGGGIGPEFALGGTLYPTAHEPDDCNGVDGSIDGIEVVLEVTDDAGTTVEVEVNRAGNFYVLATDAPEGFGPPFQVRVVTPDGERAMLLPAPNGDCNGCHTQEGAEDAPGRIILP